MQKTILFILIFFGVNLNPYAQEALMGKLKVNLNLPEEFYAVIDDNLIEAQKVDSGSVIELEPGLHSFVIASRFIDDHFFHALIERGEMTEYNHTFSVFRLNYKSTFNQLENEQNLHIRTDPGSEIFLDGEYIGKHTQSLLLNPGTYTIETVHPTSGSLKEKVTIDYVDDKYVARFNIPQHNYSGLSNILPGAGYILNGQENKAIATYITLALLAGSYYSIEKKITRRNQIWDVWDVEKLEPLRTASLIGIGVVYVFSVIDGSRKPKNGYPERSMIFGSESMSFTNTNAPTVGFRLRF